MIIDIESITQEYDAKVPTYKNLQETISYELSNKIKHIKIHSISSRIKELGSLLNKIRSKNIEKPFEQIHDIVGFRIICLFLSDLKEIEKIIYNEFEVFEKDDKVNDIQANIFGYMSLHLKANLKSSFKSSYVEDIKKIPFEIQVRTIAQDAWASISHYLDYKNENVIPDNLKRDLNALSGLFYIADTHFALIRKEQSSVLLEKFQTNQED